MRFEWRECSLGELLNIKHGFAFSGEHISKNQGKRVLVTPGNFEIGGGFKEGNAKYFHGPYPEEYVFAPGDLIVTMTDLSKTADTLGYSAKIPREECKIYLHNQRVGKVIAKSSDANLDFLYWVMRHKDYRSLVVSTATGSTARHTSPSRILAYSFLLPPPSQQQAIAHILGTLDDKIELNRKTNETLEAMAKALFKSWFVDFDPVRAKAEGRPTGLPAEISDLFPDSFVDSELGEIPSGWKMETLGEILDVDKGVSYKGDFLSDTEGLPMVNLGCFAGGGAFRAEKMKFYAGEYRERHLASAGDLLVANTDMTQNRIILGAPIIVPPWRGRDKFLFSHYMFAIRFRRSKSTFARFVYFTLLKPSFRQVAAGHATGTTVLALPKDGITDYQTVIPPAGLLNVFAANVEALYQKCQVLTEQSELLAKTRDALLPKLISGEIRIPDAEKMLEEVGV
jgi:type I restriction enzyme S subunit